jgi:NADPH-dependent ferric siderophore reductase
MRPVGAYYTVRHHRPEGHEIDLDMVLHESHNSEGGYASKWAATAAAGEPVALWGPRVSYEPQETTSEIYVFVDETGIPAASCIIESMPAELRAHVFIEVDGPADEVAMSGGDRVEVEWLHRHGAPPGSTTLLADAAALATPRPDPDTVYVYGGAESRVMASIRKHVRRKWRVPKESVSLVPYWRATAG